MNIFNREEKKVEYIELIYDLIFVYMVGRNNALLHHTEGGFISGGTFLAFFLSSLAVIQIWNFTIFYINMYGKNRLRDFVFLFINMYLLYFVGEGTRHQWEAYQSQYHIAWGLILVNIGVQYLIEMKSHSADVWNREIIKKMCLILFVEAAIVFVAAIPIPTLGVIASAVAIFFGIVATFMSRKTSAGNLVDFMHLTERAMLYVVFTFGEMIIVISGYFIGDGTFDLNTIYFSLMAFLIVVGLFLSYGIIYDHLLDREKEENGLLYMLIHVFIIFALNSVTVSLEFMRSGEIDVLPKIVFLLISMIGYYVFLFLTGKYAKAQCRFHKNFILEMILLAVAFVVLMLLFRNNMYINILATVLYVFAIFGILYRAKKRVQNFKEAF